MVRVLARGAEAIIEQIDGTVKKSRIPKGYRNPELDLKLRRQRTRREAKILSELNIAHPELIGSDYKDMTIVMQHIKGRRLSEELENLDYIEVSKQIGAHISNMHEQGIIHGDLTTSNMILAGKLYFIDFGLSYFSDKTEDKAVDLHLLEQALESRHYTIAHECFSIIKKAYRDKAVLKRLEKVDSRGRNKLKQ